MADTITFQTSNGVTWATVNGTMFKVAKTSVTNYSSGRGAYRTVWQAKRGGMLVTADTRQGAAQAMVSLLRSRGFTI